MAFFSGSPWRVQLQLLPLRLFTTVQKVPGSHYPPAVNGVPARKWKTSRSRSWFGAADRRTWESASACDMYLVCASVRFHAWV